jgi:hypothetical protein
LIDAGGQERTRLKIPTAKHHWSNEVHAILPAAADVTVITGEPGFGIQDAQDDVSPVVRRMAWTGAELGVERVPTPAWWQADHSTGTPHLRAHAGGGTLWIVSPTAIFYRTDDWHTIAAPGASERATAPVMPLVSVPMNFGVARVGSESDFALGIRPEVILAPNRLHPKWGIGAFGELTKIADHTTLGGGVTAVRYGRALAMAASVGADAVYVAGDAHAQPVISVFLGARPVIDVAPIDLPYGIRLDARVGTATLPGTVTVSLAIDAIGVGAAVYGIGALLSR